MYHRISAGETYPVRKIVSVMEDISVFENQASNLKPYEPVFGYERAQKTSPSPHTTDRIIFGIRVSWGLELFAIEVAILRTGDSETIGALK